MARVVGVHGVGNQFHGENTLRAEWLPALKDGLARADRRLASDEDFACAFYGNLFRSRGKTGCCGSYVVNLRRISSIRLKLSANLRRDV
jgi:hypothetical protein